MFALHTKSIVTLNVYHIHNNCKEKIACMIQYPLTSKSTTPILPHSKSNILSNVKLSSQILWNRIVDGCKSVIFWLGFRRNLFSYVDMDVMMSIYMRKKP